jgi:FkbM family methyltransferase
VTLILEADRAAPYVGPGSVVVDLGANVGAFTRWAAQRGANVVAVEPVPSNADEILTNVARDYPTNVRVIRAAAGTGTKARLVAPGDPAAVSTGTIAVADPDGGVPMLDLAAILHGSDLVDVLKCDIQGGEYALFGAATDVDLLRCRLITIERHQWTTPDEAPVEGWGVCAVPPMPRDAYGQLAERMRRTHQVVEDADLLYCYRDGAP